VALCSGIRMTFPGKEMGACVRYPQARYKIINHEIDNLLTCNCIMALRAFKLITWILESLRDCTRV